MYNSATTQYQLVLSLTMTMFKSDVHSFRLSRGYSYADAVTTLADCSVNDRLIKAATFMNQSFFQMIDVTSESLLQNAPDHLVTGLKSGLFGGQYCGPMKSGVSADSSATVLRAQ